MFCNNCGNQVPDGSRFCSACGTKLFFEDAPATEIPSFANYGVQAEELPVVGKTPAVSFDWSSVKDEPHKRVVSDVVSPWGNTAAGEDAKVPVEVVSDQRSRTMSFIDILKKEREEKARAAEEEARSVTDKMDVAGDYSAFDQAQSAPSFYMPPMYDDIGTPASTPFDEPKYESFEPIFEAVDEEDPALADLNVKVQPAEEPAFSGFDYSTLELNADEVAEESAKAVGLDAELAAILEAGAGNVAEEPTEQYAEVTPEVEEPAVEETVYEEPAVEEPVVVVPEQDNEYIDLESLVAELSNKDEAEGDFDDTQILINGYLEEEEEAQPEEVAPVVEEPAVDPKLAEIEELKARLAELMGSSEPVAQAEEIPVEEPFAEEIAIEEIAKAEPVYEEPAYEEIAVQLDENDDETEEAAVVIPDIEDFEEVVEEPASTDAMSVEDLERDLFGDVAEPEVDPEATKKIDKFYTLYKKNEEFQKLLDEEYNKLKSGAAEAVPTVSAVLDEVEKPAEAAVEAVVEEPAQVEPKVTEIPVADEVVTELNEEPVSLFSEEPADEEFDDEEETAGKGSTVLTVIAVVIAVLLVILLAVILVLNFAPDSGIALKIDSVIETITSYFSVVDVPGSTSSFLL